ncbi:MAG TPA: hypothetical protein VMB85_12430 [Bryobacteraceae bacterium]|nr:hypothetical protein [Bryobacteraceae bacterium]
MHELVVCNDMTHCQHRVPKTVIFPLLRELALSRAVTAPGGRGSSGVMYDDVIEMNIPQRVSIAGCVALLLAAPFDAGPAKAQSSQSSGYGVGGIDKGLVVGAIVGVAALVGLGITFLVLHNRGIVVGCVTESGGKRTLVELDKKTYSLLDGGPALVAGDRAKLKGHKSGPASAPSFQVEKVVKDYGRCQP